jgi:preprotein translocase subunit YajC
MTNMTPLTSAAALLAQTAAPAPNPLFSMLPLFLLVGGMYFLMIAPQRRKQKALEKMLAALQTGDEVITTGGLYGVITNVKDDRYVIRIGDATKIEVAKGFIQSVVKKDGVEEPKS